MSVDVGGVVPGAGVPYRGDGLAGELEWHGALDGAGGPVAPPEQGVVDCDGDRAARPGPAAPPPALLPPGPGHRRCSGHGRRTGAPGHAARAGTGPPRASMPHTVRRPACVRNPQARPQNVRNDGAVNSGAKDMSSLISETGAGSVASGSIGGNPFHRRFHEHRRCSRTR